MLYLDYKIIMGNDKRIRLSSLGSSIYQGENNCDFMEVLLPSSYGQMDFLTSSVLLNWVFHCNNETIDSDESTAPMDGLEGNVKSIDLEEDEEHEGYLSAKIPISINYTKRPGIVELWIEVKAEEKLLLKTNTVQIEIKNHIDITDYIPAEQIDLLSDMLVKLRQLQNNCNSTLQKAKEQADKATIAAETIIKLMQEWEDEHGSKE